jgi:hypothetical protein
MGNYQKAISMLSPEQRASLKAGGSEPPVEDEDEGAGAQDPESDEDDPGDSQQTDEPVYTEDKQYTFEDGKFVEVVPPTPLKHNEKGRADLWLPETDEPDPALRVDRSWP